MDKPQERDMARRMAEAATAFLDELQKVQRAKALIDFVDEQERRNWHYVPCERAGLPLAEMDAGQRRLALELVATGLSAMGYQKVSTIMGLERILADLEGPDRRFARDPELYYVTLFGTPDAAAPWGWRFEGHHVSLNYTLVEGRLAGPAPNFLGANPARVLHGEREGLRALRDEEDTARELLSSLDGEQRRMVVISPEAPPDILTRNLPHARGAIEPEGLPASAMSEGQRELLRALVRVYVNRLPDAAAETALNQVERADWPRVRFAWMGAVERGRPHYYRVQGPTLLLEYDNTQNDANHIHAVWRDLENDFGIDLLKRHYRQAHA